MTSLPAPVSFIARAFRFSGRATRTEFWWTFLLLYLAISALLIVGDRPYVHPRTETALTLAAYALTVPLLAVGTRRLADAGVWRWLFVFTFVFGQISMLVYMFVRPELRDLWMLTFNAERLGATLPASGYEISHALRLIRDDILPWASQILAIACLILAALPSRRDPAPSGPQSPEVTP